MPINMHKLTDGHTLSEKTLLNLQSAREKSLVREMKRQKVQRVYESV